MKYTNEQIEIALGVMSGRINPETDLRYFDDAQRLHGGLLRSVRDGGLGNPGPDGNRRKAEEIVMSLLCANTQGSETPARGRSL